MSGSTIRRELVEEKEQPRPAAALLEAMVAVLERDPDRPILLAEDTYVRASYLVLALAPEALERANANIKKERQ